MTLTTENDSTATAIITVRVPRNSDTDLATDAECRIARAAGVSDATVDELRGIEPRLSATIVTVAVTVETIDDTDIDDRFAATHGIESVEWSDS